MEGWITTWKNIARYLDCSIQTAKKYHKKNKMPVYRLPGGNPAILTPEVNRWLIEYSKRLTAKKGNFRISS
ncbi:MAG: hypothetical protein ABIK28_25665 [Planctomycetota bacterium]